MLSELGADGVNPFNCCGADGWQTVSHFHLHVIPRHRDKSKDRLELTSEPGIPGDADAIAERTRVLAAALLRWVCAAARPRPCAHRYGIDRPTAAIDATTALP
ncbi:MAG: HIT family protein [Marmoricola sp.]